MTTTNLPTGTTAKRDESAAQAGQSQSREVPSFCRICEAYCGTMVTVTDGRIAKISPDTQHPISQGYLCPKGKAIGKLITGPRRVRSPQHRSASGQFTAVSWERALDDIAVRLSKIIDDHGPQSVAMYIGNPSAFNPGMLLWATGFMAAIGSDQLHTPGPQDTLPRQLASERLYNSAMKIPIPDWPRSDMALILGANPLVSHGSLLTNPRIGDDLKSIVSRGGRVVVVDPVRTKTAAAFEHVQLRPGTDAWFLAALIRDALAHDDAAARGPRRRASNAEVTGIQALRAAVEPFTFEAVASLCDVSSEQIASVSEAFRRADAAVAYSRVGLCRNLSASTASYLVDCLNAVTGNLAVPGGSIFGDAPIDLVRLASMVGLDRSGRLRTRTGSLKEVAGLLPWTLPDDIETPGDGQIKALICVAGNPVVSAPEGERLATLLDGLDLVVGVDLQINETLAHAHYVLPTASMYEREELPIPSMHQMARPYLQLATPVVSPPEGVREEWQIFDDLAARMKLGPPLKTPKLPGLGVAARLGRAIGARLTPHQAVGAVLATSRSGDLFGLRRGGLSLKKLRALPRGVAIASRPQRSVRVNVGDLELLGQLASPDLYAPRHDAVLVGRRSTQMVNSWMRPRSVDSTLWVHPDDAQRWNLVDGCRAEVKSDTGSVEVPISINDAVARGVVSYPHGFGNKSPDHPHSVNINGLISSAPSAKDPISGASFLDGYPVTVSRL
ncbi:MAG: molybdopterin-dependent oxidoreductase [Actinobacteria bacterium]|nr:molybdopterin-dependent oxidoreductase [Actinomycetota bacterium]MCB9390096.1 molybdopterin-dependent oxidoreductase [Acidimicrobiia bacterium]